MFQSLPFRTSTGPSHSRLGPRSAPALDPTTDYRGNDLRRPTHTWTPYRVVRSSPPDTSLSTPRGVEGRYGALRAGTQYFLVCQGAPLPRVPVRTTRKTFILGRLRLVHAPFLVHEDSKGPPLSWFKYTLGRVSCRVGAPSRRVRW